MSLKDNKRRSIVWILVIMLVFFAVIQARPLSFVILPGSGYRAYEWTWKFRIEDVGEDLYPEYPNIVKHVITEELGKITDDKSQSVTIYNGPTFLETSVIWEDGPWWALWDVFTVECETHIWFYGYFPNGIPDAVPLSSVSGPFDQILDSLCPRAYAIGPLLVLLVLIVVAGIVGSLAITTQYFITHENLLNERQRSEESEDWPDWMQAIYFVIQSILGWLQTLGPAAIILIGAVAAVLIFSGGGKRRR